VQHFILVPRSVRYVFTKSHIHKRCGTLRKKIFSTMKYVEIHKQRPFFVNRKDTSKIVVLEIQMVSTCIGASFTHRLLFS
jgi:hypothetical protein